MFSSILSRPPTPSEFVLHIDNFGDYPVSTLGDPPDSGPGR